MTGTRRRAALALLALAVLAACEAEPAPGPAGPLSIVTTAAPLTSIVANIGGDLVRITSVVPEAEVMGAAPVAGAAQALAAADLVLANGLGLDDPVLALARETAPTTATVVQIGAAVLRDAGEPFRPAPDPHLWTDPLWAARYADVVKDLLVANDPAHAERYIAHHRDFVGKATDLSTALQQDQRSLPRARRQLVTSRDAWGRFATRYGWAVAGGAPRSGEQPPARVARVSALVGRLGVPAVFPSPGDDDLRRVAALTGVRADESLRLQDLPGVPGDPEHSWLGLMRSNYRAMLRALGGTTTALDALAVADVAPDRATYPQ
jgi:ABC-type Zn uptake system ZnuABC Zn-binding protein ZnuA